MPNRFFKILSNRFIYILLLATPIPGKGQPNVSIAQPFSDTILCVGSSLKVNFNVTPSYFDTLNYFTVQLSDTDGSFSNPAEIGKINILISYFVNCSIPTNIPSGTNYRIRVVASSPKDTSLNNGKPIRISQFPSVSTSNNSPVCPGANTTLNLFGNSNQGTTFKWTGPNNYSAATKNANRTNIQFADSGYYVLTADYYGCKSKDSVFAIVMTPPNAHILPHGFVNTCEGDNFGLTDSNNVPGVKYSWKGPSNFSSSGIGSSAFTYVNIPKKYTGWFVLTATVNGGCSTKDSVWVNVSPRPDSPTISSNSPICLGDDIKFFGSSSTPGASFIWRGPNNFSSSAQNPVINNASYADAGDYFGSAKHPSGCVSLESKLRIIIGTPVTPPTISGSNMLCKGDSLILNANSSNPGMYQWVGPGGNIITNSKTLALGNATPADAGIYSVTLNNMGCTSTPATINMIVTEVPTPTASNNGPICDGNTLMLRAQDIPGANYSWQGPANFNSILQNPVISTARINTGGIYTVKAFLLNCSSTSTTYAEVNPIPAIKNTGSNSPVCIGSELKLYTDATIPSSFFSWRGPSGFNSLVKDPAKNIFSDGAGMYYVKATAKGCTSPEDSIWVETKELPALPVVSNNGPLNTGQALYLHASCATQGATLKWDGPLAFSSPYEDASINEITTDYAGDYTATATYNGCISSTKTNVIVNVLNSSVLTLSPNPNNGHFNLSGYTKTNSPVFMEIVNMNGQITYRSSALPVHKRFDFSVDTENLMSGPYMFYITTVGERQTFRFIVNR